MSWTSTQIRALGPCIYICYPVRDVRRVKCDEQGSNVIMMLLCMGHKCNCESIHMWTHAHVCACGWIWGGVSECPVWMLEGAYTAMYLPPRVLFNPLWGMNEDIIIFLPQSLSLLLFLFLSLSLNVEPPWEGGGAILGTTPHPTNASQHQYDLSLHHHHVYLHYQSS